MNEYNGGIGVYFPQWITSAFLLQSVYRKCRILFDKVIRSLLQYVNDQTVPLLYTWSGVNNSLLTDRFNSQRQERQIKTMFRDYKSLSGTLRQQLVDLGFNITEDGKHYRLAYYGDGLPDWGVDESSIPVVGNSGNNKRTGDREYGL